RTVQDFDSAARTFGNFNAVQTRSLILGAGTDGPDLARRKRVVADLIFTLQFGRDHKLFNAFLAERVTKLGVAELSRADPFLLLLHAAAAFQSQANSPFQVFVGDGFFGRWMD